MSSFTINVPKRSIVIGSRKTSVSIEDGFWDAFIEIANERKMTMSALATYINARRKSANLSSEIRLFVLRYYIDQLKNETVAQKDDGAGRRSGG
jgi:predicted DNA-binding ribbon-helix-helix protein